MASVFSSTVYFRLFLKLVKQQPLFSRVIYARYGSQLLQSMKGKQTLSGTGCFLGVAYFQLKAVAAASSQQPLPGTTLRQFFSDIDRLHTTGSEAEGYQRLNAALSSGDPGYACAEVYWRLARGSRAMANSCGSGPGEQADKRKAFTYEAYSWAQKALEADPNNGSCHKWMGIMIGLIGSYEGTTKRIENSYLMRDHLRRAVEFSPGDAVTLHCLGAWCFEVADLPWYQRKIAATFFATPPSSSYDEALGYLIKAEEADPNFYSCNQLYIGKAYLRKGDKVNARKWLQRTVEYKGDTFDDRQSRDEATQLLKSC